MRSFLSRLSIVLTSNLVKTVDSSITLTGHLLAAERLSVLVGVASCTGSLVIDLVAGVGTRV